jgi:hypothetical protein
MSKIDERLAALPECADGKHYGIVRDRFAEDFRGSRKYPGNCYCLKCSQPVDAWWNNGNPKPVGDEDWAEYAGSDALASA